ncbi:hypothetical protein PMAYCL1PPCAC_21872 [Pristionchus mayeri]|uniref:Phospholipid scramblase n=1 Tax=Pristionchus mayeri TaxID=1317129 RepID=A0AAN5CW58_9BILA|nr:hypothetical protein PMAYCL1PPCAC_21872 [Pristionchus mayeri]
MLVRRRFNCCGMGCACCQCCQEFVEIEAPPGVVIGSVVQQCGVCEPHYVGRDVSGKDIFEIVGPNCCMMSSCCDKIFEVRIGAAKVGEIRKRWAGLLQEAFTEADNFGVSFPAEMPVIHKAILLGATFLIDFMHFEEDGNNNGILGAMA